MLITVAGAKPLITGPNEPSTTGEKRFREFRENKIRLAREFIHFSVTLCTIGHSLKGFCSPVALIDRNCPLCLSIAHVFALAHQPTLSWSPVSLVSSRLLSHIPVSSWLSLWLMFLFRRMIKCSNTEI
jgi:hypothetical protein